MNLYKKIASIVNSNRKILSIIMVSAISTQAASDAIAYTWNFENKMTVPVRVQFGETYCVGLPMLDPTTPATAFTVEPGTKKRIETSNPYWVIRNCWNTGLISYNYGTQFLDSNGHSVLTQWNETNLLEDDRTWRRTFTVNPSNIFMNNQVNFLFENSEYTTIFNSSACQH